MEAENGNHTPMETTVPGIFIAGDVRHGSLGRIASAVGDAAAAVKHIYT